ncbi:MAG: ABC transporter permease [Deltaproteobacteria bacterium]|nr:ABC transporter permease [Deltaproteobacteria bacterium]
MKKHLSILVFLYVFAGLFMVNAAVAAAAEPIKVGRIDSFTGFLEYFAKECQRGFELGIKYATQGTNKINGRPIVIIKEDTQLNPQIARQKALKLIDQDKVHFLVGATGSADSLAIQPIAAKDKVPHIVAGSTASSITGSNWNKYTFRVNRNNLQDAIAWGHALGDRGLKVAILAEDTAGGREGMAALKKVLAEKGADLVYEVYVPLNTTDFTPFLQKIVAAKPAFCALWWAGANSPWNQMMEAFKPTGIKISSSTVDIMQLRMYKDVTDQLGRLFSFYYYTFHKNPVNDWLVKNYQAEYGMPPTYSTEVGMAAAILMCEALKKTNGNTDPDALVKAMEGMTINTAKGIRIMRAEDHTALQEMYIVHLVKKAGVDWAVPVLERTLKPEETAPPVLNKR